MSQPCSRRHFKSFRLTVSNTNCISRVTPNPDANQINAAAPDFIVAKSQFGRLWANAYF